MPERLGSAGHPLHLADAGETIPLRHAGTPPKRAAIPNGASLLREGAQAGWLEDADVAAAGI